MSYDLQIIIACALPFLAIIPAAPIAWLLERREAKRWAAKRAALGI